MEQPATRREVVPTVGSLGIPSADTAPDETPVSGFGAGEHFRPDIEGLRGVAVLLVVLFHAGLGAVAGGFIGVDVFFVISGYLITGLLLRELERDGRIGLQAFYARRIRRLLPAGTVVLLVTLAVSWFVLAPIDRPSAALDGAAAAASVGNIRFALAAGDYFAAVATPSPFLHFWSLGVEEQFYLVWPALLLWVGRGRRPRMGVGVALGVIFAISLVANFLVTDTAVNWAFYSLPTRAWQLALGGLVAVGAAQIARVSWRVLATAGWVALVSLIAAAFLFSADLPYPGLAAVVPTFAAAMLIAAGTVRDGPAILLSFARLRFVGRISYSLYLWHWPVLVLPAIAAGGDLDPLVRLALVAVAISLAWLSWRFVEEPFRRGGRRTRLRPAAMPRHGRTIGAGLAAVLLVVLSAGSLAAVGSADAGLTGAVQPSSGPDEPDPTDPEDSGFYGTPGPSPSGPPSVSSMPTPSHGPSPSTGSTDTPEPTVVPTGSPTPEPTVTPTPVIALPADVRPPLAKVRADEERLRRDGCLAFESVTTPPDCRYADPAGTYTVALVGDSHASMWFPAVERVAKHRGWRLLTYVKVSCPFLDMPVRNLALKREYRECASFRAATLDRLRAEAPDMVIVTMTRFGIFPLREADRTVEAQGAALARLLLQVPGKPVVLVDTPHSEQDIPSCLSRNISDVRKCAIPQDVALERVGAMEHIAADQASAGLVDLTARICPADPCPVVIDDMIVLRDDHHLTATFSRALAPDLDLALDPFVVTP